MRQIMTRAKQHTQVVQRRERISNRNKSYVPNCKRNIPTRILRKEKLKKNKTQQQQQQTKHMNSKQHLSDIYLVIRR